MFDRRALGDLALAILLVLPLTNLAASHAINDQPAGKTSHVAADRSPGGRIGLLG